MAIQGNPSPTRLPFLDGLRGLTALYVVLYHCYFTEITSLGLHENYSLAQRLAIHWLGLGEEAMAVFVVLSGFSLMRNALLSNAQLHGGAAGFLWHRAKRLLIPYYVALLILLLLIKTIPTMNRINLDLFSTWNPEPNLSSGNLASHFLLFPNLKYAWKYSIDPPCWGVAAFWWLYVLFALLLLPLWRKIGGLPTALLTLALTTAPHFFLHGKDNAASPWFVGIFTIGMAAASSTGCQPAASRTGCQPVQNRTDRPAPWLAIAAVLFAASLYLGVLHEHWIAERVYALDILVGCATACFVIFCAKRMSAGGLPFPISLLEWRVPVELGRLSYSLFLVHFPVLWLLHVYVTLPMTATAFEKFAVLAAAGVPSAWAMAAIFHVNVERHFMSKQN
ncbi:MAG TPA: acyltransferase [Planctomycetota bacterium]|nr:acyltransferase [Planctomycetota bacterium]